MTVSHIPGPVRRRLLPSDGDIRPLISIDLATLDTSATSWDVLAATVESEARRILQADDVVLAREDKTQEQVNSGVDRDWSLEGTDWVLRTRGHRGSSSDNTDAFLRQVGMLVRTHETLVAGRRRQAELSALYETAGQLTSHLEVQPVLSTIVEKARELSPSDLSYITLVDAQAGVVRMCVSTGHQTTGFLETVLPIGAGVGGVVAATQQPVCSADYLNDPRISHHAATDDRVRGEGIRSIMGVPLRGRNDVLGVLYVANRTPHDYRREEIALLVSLGDLAAMALQNARLYEDAVAAASAATVSRAEAERHLRELEQGESVHRRLTEVLLQGRGIGGVAESLAGALGVEVVITDWRQRVLSHVGGSSIVGEKGTTAASILNRVEVKKAVAECSRSHAAVEIGSHLIVAPISAQQEILGFIWASVASNLAKGALRTTLEQAARVVALEYLRDRTTAEVERRLRRDFIYELVSPHPASESVLAWRARQVWPRFSIPHRPVVIKITETDDGDAPIEQARELIGDARPGEFAAAYGNHVIVMIELVERDAASAEAKRLRGFLSRHGLHATVVIGVVSTSLSQDRETILGALHLEDLLGSRPVLLMDGLGLLTTLFDASQRDRLNTFLEATLAPFSKHPRLLATLESYYQSSGNRALAARRLNIHVNTLRYRIEQIEDLLGGSLEDSTRSLPLQLAILVKGSVVANL